MPTKHYAGLTAILPLFLIIFIDSLGMGMIFPLLNPLYMSATGVLPPGASMPVRNFLYGLTLAVFPLGMFFGVPILGDLSDQIGRKKVLLLCLMGVGISYLLSVAAIIIDSVSLLIISRITSGLFAGSIAIAQAAVIDVSPPEKKVQNISIMLLPATLGFILGPLSSFLTNQHFIIQTGLWAPLLLAGTLALANALLLQIGFAETHQRQGKLRFKLH